MLAYILAIIIACTSITLYLSAFFLPEMHRQDDFLWSGIGLFYALVLWICAERITGGILFGQSAAVILVISFGWQTVRLRRIIAHPDKHTDFTSFSILSWIKSRLTDRNNSTVPDVPSPAVETVQETKKPLSKDVSQQISKDEKISTEELDVFPEMAETFIQESAEITEEELDVFPEMAETFIQESTEAISLMRETETGKTSVKETPESLVPDKKFPLDTSVVETKSKSSTDKELPSSSLTVEPTEELRETPILEIETESSTDEELPSSSLTGESRDTSIVETESSTTREAESQKNKEKGFSLSSLFRFIKLKPKPSSEISEITTESSNRQELEIDKEDQENSETLEKFETFEAVPENKAMIEDEITEALEQREELAAQQVKEENKEENFEVSEQPQATTIIVDGTEVTPETVEIEQLQEKKEETLKTSIPEEISPERSEETQTTIADNKSQIGKSLNRENSQETNLDTDNLETESSTSGFFEISAKEKDTQSDKNDDKLS